MSRHRVILLALLFQCFTITAEDIRVPEDYPTLQEALDRARDGDRIVITGGTHRGPFSIRTSVSIEGEEGTLPILYDDTSPVRIIPLLLVQNAGKVRLSNLIIQGGDPSQGVGATSVGILAIQSRIRLSEVSFRNILQYGLLQIGGDFEAEAVSFLTPSLPGRLTDTGLAFFGVSGVTTEHLVCDDPILRQGITINSGLPFGARTSLSRPFIFHPSTGAPLTLPSPPSGPTQARLSGIRLRIPSEEETAGVVVGGATTLTIEDSYFYMGPTRPRPLSPTAVIARGNPRIVVRNTTFSGVTRGILLTTGSPSLLLEDDTFTRLGTALTIREIPGSVLDLGGGPLGSRGGNRFQGNTFDILLDPLSVPLPIPARNNLFSPSPLVHSTREDGGLPERILVTE